MTNGLDIFFQNLINSALATPMEVEDNNNDNEDDDDDENVEDDEDEEDGNFFLQKCFK